MTMAHLLEADRISKYYGNVVALNDVSAHVNAGEVACILGDNGAGKSSFIKILSGSHAPDGGRLLVGGEEVRFASPRDARANGIATVYQDLAMVPLMSIWRNFFLGAEPRKGVGLLRWLDAATAKRIVRKELSEMGIDIRDPDQPVGTLSGGERQSVAIARAVYFGAHPRRADVGARRQAGRRRPQVHPPGPGPGRCRHLHHAQPAPRLPGRRPLRDPQPRPESRQLRQGRHRPAGARPPDGGWAGARGARARARRDQG
jgi:ABC-type lipoprotein export system ATPase subunit